MKKPIAAGVFSDRCGKLYCIAVDACGRLRSDAMVLSHPVNASSWAGSGFADAGPMS